MRSRFAAGPRPHSVHIAITDVILSPFEISPGHEGVLRLRHVADVRFWARLRTKSPGNRGKTRSPGSPPFPRRLKNN